MLVQSIERFFVGALGIACGAMFVLLLRGAAIASAVRAETTHAALLVHSPSTHPTAALLAACEIPRAAAVQ